MDAGGPVSVTREGGSVADEARRPLREERAASAAMPDDELLRRLKAGEDTAFEVLVARFGGRMLAVARRLVGTTHCEDVLQEAFVQAYRAIERFEERSSLGTWLHRITVNAALMHLRSRDRRPEESIDALLDGYGARGFRAEPLWTFPRSSEELLESRQVTELVREKIAALPDGYRIVITLRDIEGLDTAEVAELLDMTEGAVKTRLHRARTALKNLLGSLWRDARG